MPSRQERQPNTLSQDQINQLPDVSAELTVEGEDGDIDLGAFLQEESERFVPLVESLKTEDSSEIVDNAELQQRLEVAMRAAVQRNLTVVAEQQARQQEDTTLATPGSGVQRLQELRAEAAA